MPRTARIDIPGILQHVIVRGIERCDIFLDDHDRQSFVDRLACLLEKSGTECLAWALMSNHFHLLLRTSQTKLSTFMRRLLTGHAVTFNLRYGRVGHLFQNRYKSIVCEEEAYLLELIRYIHLNPLRAGVVKDLAGLDRYPWSGHAVLMGKGELAGQATEEVLSRFGRGPVKSRRAYREFMADGISQGRRGDLLGGGLKRSRSEEGRDFEAFDERILGSGEFVENILNETGAGEPMQPLISLDLLVKRVAEYYGIAPDTLTHRTRHVGVGEARGVLCHLAVRLLGYSGAEVARALRMSRAGVCIATERGGELLGRNLDLREKILAS